MFYHFQTESIATIQNHSFQPDKKINFTVAVKSQTTFQTSFEWQQITIVSHDTLPISLRYPQNLIHFFFYLFSMYSIIKYRCLKNCGLHKTVTTRLVHIVAECIPSCPPSSISTFTWKLIEPSTQTLPATTKKHLIIPPSFFQSIGTYLIEASVTDESGKIGKSQIQIETYFEPLPATQITCSIKPTVGIEFRTVFHVICENTHDAGQLKYSLLQNGMPLTTSNNAKFMVRLNANAVVRMNVADIFGAELSVPMPAISVNAALSANQTLDDTETLLNQIDEVASTMASIVILNTVLAAMPTFAATEKLLLTAKLFDRIRMVEINRFPQLIAFADIVSRIVLNNTESIIADQMLLLKITTIFDKISTDLSTHFMADEFTNAGDEIRSTTQILMEVIEAVTVPIVSDTFVDATNIIEEPDPLNEHYPDYGEVDESILERSENRLAQTNAIIGLVTALSYSFARNMEANEPEVRVDVKNITYIARCQDDESDDDGFQFMTTVNNNVIATVWNARTQFVATTIFHENPLWWLPDTFASVAKSDVILLNMITPPTTRRGIRQRRASKFERSSSSQTTIDMFTSTIKAAISKIKFSTNKAILFPKGDMPVYKLRMTPNSLITISFELAIGVNVRAMINVRARPKFRDFSHMPFHVISNGSEIKFLTKEANAEDDVVEGYIAFSPQVSAMFVDEKSSINILYRVYAMSCNSWKAVKWSSQKCRPAVGSNLDRLHCKCYVDDGTETSLFYSKLYVAPNRLSLPRLLIDVSTYNPLVVGCVCILLLVYCTVLVWAWKTDHLDEERNGYRYINESGAAAADHQECSNDIFIITVATGLYWHAGNS